MTEFQVVPGDFVDALGDALIFVAGTGIALPMLAAVYLEGAKGEQSVTFTGTDRFILGQRRINTVEPLTEDFAALIPADQAKTLVGVHKAAIRARRGPGKPGEPLQIKVSDAYLTAGQISVPLSDLEFVKYRNLWPSKTAEIDELGIDLTLLARLSKLSVFGRGKSKGVRITSSGRNRPFSVECLGRTDDTRIIVMPYRLPERDQ